MINLLPLEDKREIRAGRSNRILLRYFILLFIAALLLAGLFGYTYWLISTEETKAKQDIITSQNKDAELAKDKQDVEAFRNNLAIAKQVLERQVKYSGLYVKIAKIIPEGAVLGQLTIDPEQFGTSTTLNAKTKSEAIARQLKNALEESDYFTNVQFISLATTADGDETDYAYTAALNVTFRKELINEK